MNRGLLSALSCSVLWGLLPLFWHMMISVSPPALLAMRVLWSAILLAALVIARGEWTAFTLTALKPRLVAVYFAASLFLGLNWGIFIWAIGHGHMVDVSLGSFIFPLANVVLGIALFQERLRPVQWLAVALAAAGVVYLSWSYGAPPWIALVQAFNFACYGAIKKKAPLSPIFGLMLETLSLAPVAALYLGAATALGGAPLPADWGMHGLFVLSGFVTTAPLFLFAVATRTVPLSVLGITQYIAPTLSLFVAVLSFGEPFTHVQMVGFGFVWAALVIFTLDGIRLSMPRRDPVSS